MCFGTQRVMEIAPSINTYSNCGEMLVFASIQYNYHRLRRKMSALNRHETVNSAGKVSSGKSIKYGLRPQINRTKLV